MSNEDEQKTPEATAFALKSDAAFGSRVGDIFGNLGHIEAKHNAYQKARSQSGNDDEGQGLIKDDPQDDGILGLGSKQFDESFSAKNSSTTSRGFKRPHLPAPRGGRCPDFKVNPKKWTYYNLEDVSPDAMSERSNTEAAKSFLDSVDTEAVGKKQKMDSSDVSSEPAVDKEGSPAKVLFRKPDRREGDLKALPDLLHGGRKGTVMPEYVIGQKPATRRSRPTKSATAMGDAAITISHVMEDNIDEDDDSISDASLEARPTRTVFSGCLKDDEEAEKPVKTEESFIGFLGKNSRKHMKKAIRHTKDSDSDDECTSPAKDDADFDGVD